MPDSAAWNEAILKFVVLYVGDAGVSRRAEVHPGSVSCVRRQADWRIVERGWNAHVLGQAEHTFKDALTAVTTLRVRSLHSVHGLYLCKCKQDRVCTWHGLDTAADVATDANAACTAKWAKAETKPHPHPRV